MEGLGKSGELKILAEWLWCQNMESKLGKKGKEDIKGL